MKKNIIIFLLCFAPFSYGNIAPDFPEAHHFFDSDFQVANEIDYVFNGRRLTKQQRIGVSLAHQNREWQYNWVLLALVFPTKVGHISFGYSNYGTNAIPITKSDSIGPYINGYSSDTFESILVSYEPKVENINLQMISNFKFRRLVGHTAKALVFDIQASSPLVLNNQLGIRTKNIIGTPYRWSHGTQEALAKYVGLYFIQEMSIFTVLIEQDICVNYDNLHMFMGHISMALDKNISIFSSYRKTTPFYSLTFGSNLKLSEVFNLNYSNQNEVNENLDLSVHSISIGVKF